jgi:FAD/FMN-containing dehydrogenase
MLLVLVAGADGSEVEERAGVLARLSESSGAIAAPLDEAQARSAWAARRALPSRLALRWPDVGTVEVGIPLDRVEAFVAAGDRLAGESGIGLAIYGGAGLGALGLALLDGARDQRLRLARLLVAAARAEGGQALDVVGLGLDYDDWLGLVLPDSSAAALRRVRSALDPHGTLQPART